VGGFTCSGTGKTVVHDNAYFTPTGEITECHKSLADWQAQFRARLDGQSGDS